MGYGRDELCKGRDSGHDAAAVIDTIDRSAAMSAPLGAAFYDGTSQKDAWKASASKCHKRGLCIPYEHCSSPRIVPSTVLMASHVRPLLAFFSLPPLGISDRPPFFMAASIYTTSEE